MHKILFTDLDGTLLNNQSQISAPMKKCLDEMTDAGHKLVLSSGRPLNSIMEVKEKAGINYPGIYIIANNGSLIYDCDNHKSIYELRLTMEDVKMVWETAKEMHIHIQTYTDSAIVFPNEDEEIAVYRSRVHMPLIISDQPWLVLKQPPFKLLAIDLYEKKHLISLSDALLQEGASSLTTIFSNDRYLEIFSAKAGKGNGLIWLCNYLSTPVSASVACGDALNDLSMLKAAGTSVAMCNGDDTLKAGADIVTAKTNDENGLIDIIRNHILK